MNCAPSMNSEGAIAGGVAIVDDITERKQAENTLIWMSMTSDGASLEYIIEHRYSCLS
jgi:hypothetical protein